MAEVQGELQRLSGTTLDAAGAANVLAGTTDLELVGAVNAWAGTSGLELAGAIKTLTGSTKDPAGALADFEGGGGGATVSMLFPQVDGNYASTPDSAAVSITGDIDMRMKLALTSWTGATQLLVAKFNAPPHRAYQWYLLTDGKMHSNYSTTGSDLIGGASTAAVGFTNGETNWVRVTRAADSGEIKYYTSDDGETWNQLGTTVTLGTGNLADTDADLFLGANTPSGTLTIGGDLYYAEILDGIDGTPAAVFDPSTDVTVVGTRDPSSFDSSATGETWTINGSAWDWTES